MATENDGGMTVCLEKVAQELFGVGGYCHKCVRRHRVTQNPEAIAEELKKLLALDKVGK